MHKRHAASKEYGLTRCGYECTDAEYTKMRGRKAALVNCVRCLKNIEMEVRRG